MIKKAILNIDKSCLENCTICISGSKSISQRALIIHFLGSYSLEISNLSDSEDTAILKEILKEIEKKDDVYVGKGGTTLRFLLPLISLMDNFFYIDGDSTLVSRPLSGLIDALKRLGVKFNFKKIYNQLPFNIHGGKIVSKTIEIDSDKTSQFVSGLLLVAPYINGGLDLKLKNKVVSKPYIEMTIEMMKKCGAFVSWENNIISVREGTYSQFLQNIESDWTSLSYIYECVAISNSARIKISSFMYPSLQKDSDIVLFFNLLGVSTQFNNDQIILRKDVNYISPYYLEWDVLNTPDLMPTYLVSCFALGINLKLSGIDSLIYKESNRIKTVKIGLEKFNAKIDINDNFLTLNSSNAFFHEAEIDTFNDHRIALAFSPLVLKTKSLIINNPNVIKKSYPSYWDHLKKIGIKVFFQK